MWITEKLDGIHCLNLICLGWNKDLLPQEEPEKKPADWRPPTPPKVDLRSVVYQVSWQDNLPNPR